MTLNSGGLSFLNYKLLHNYKHRLDHRIAKVPSSANVFQASFEEFLPSNSNFEATCFLALCLSNIIAASNLQGKSVCARERLLPDLVLFTVAAFQHVLCFQQEATRQQNCSSIKQIQLQGIFKMLPMCFSI